MAIHREQEYCFRCGEPLRGVRNNMGNDFVGNTFSHWAECKCQSLLLPSPGVKEINQLVDKYVNDRYENSDNEQYFNARACKKDFTAGILAAQQFTPSATVGTDNGEEKERGFTIVSATPATVEDAVKRVFYTRADIRNISGVDLWAEGVVVDLWAEGVVYEPIQVDLRTLSNWERLSIDARYMTENPAPYIKSMMNRLELGGGLQSIIIDEDNYMTDGFHRTMAYILSNKFIVNALKRVKQ